MPDPPVPEPLFLPADPDPVFATLHRCAGPATGPAVLFCPPFGFDEVSAYRSLRFWSEQLAGSGHPALRLSLPGTGDSGGDPRQAGRLEAWVTAVGTAAARLRDMTGAQHVVAVGLGLGGMLACLAAGDGAPIDDLVLWATPARGRSLIRQLRAFSTMERSMFYDGVSTPPPEAGSELEAGGFVLTAETRTAVEAIDLTALTLPDRCRALLLARDGVPVDRELQAHLEGAGVSVTTGPGDGFADMTSGPQTARPPLAVIRLVSDWLDRPPGPETAATTAPKTAAAATQFAGPVAELRVDGVEGAVRETAITIPGHTGPMTAVLSEPLRRRSDGLCVVLLNAGAVRRIGPNRQWVEAARRWAAGGVPVLRLDLTGIGDSDGDESPYREDAALYSPAFVPQVIEAMDHLQGHGVGERFILGGLCSGAFWSFHAALQDGRVRAVMLLNPRALIWSTGLGPGRDLRALLTQRPSPAKIRRLATGPRLREFLRWLAATPLRLVRRLWSRESEATAIDRELGIELRRLVASGRPVLLLFSAHEPLHAELERTGRMAMLQAAPSVTIEYVDVRDHTMRPGWAQREVHAALDRALGREPAGPPTG